MAHRILAPLILFAAVFAGCGKPGATSGEWKPLSDAQGKFTVEMPGAPEKASYEMPIASGTMNFISYMVDMPDQAKYFMVLFVDYPAGTSDGSDASAHDVMDKYVAGGSRKKNLKLEQKTKITLGDHPGQECLFHEPEYGDKSLWRVYLVGDRLYQLVANWSPKDEGASADAQRFLQSFQLTD
jgi:hypothetical protein